MRLSGKVALITGAGSGMGRAAAELFSREGAKVVVADLVPDRAKETVSSITSQGGHATHVVCDVANGADVQAAVRQAIEQYGGLDILVANAGFTIPGAAETMDEKDWDRVVDVNTKGAWLSAKYSIPEIRKRGGGAIVFTASGVSFRASTMSPAYAVAKAGVLLLCKSLAREVAKDNIRVNCVCPGMVATRFYDNNMGVEVAKKNAPTNVPLGRIGVPEDIANAMLFLVSDEASYITGVPLVVDGGMLA